ncbi:hypothetical protein E2C01_096202 [Portunus trituberculatus]|uniref:Uncharacterized protein n=1 Tax=Portunus trituberculatus TaxID=210409 RepID=A0A5B7K6A1_PORTR|nr:hypothetical protein [Portunus trituberculatus]
MINFHLYFQHLQNFSFPAAQKSVATKGMHSMKMKRSDLA